MVSSGSPGPDGNAGGRGNSRRMWVLLLVIVVAAAALGAGYYLQTRPVATPSTVVNHPPVAVIEVSKLAPVTYDTVILNGSASSDPDGDALTYLWQLPDGRNFARVSLNFTFASVGTFRFALTVTDSHGAQNTTDRDVTVAPAPLTVGTNAPYPPFEFFNGSTIEGFDIDLDNAVATRAGYAASWQDYQDFSTLLNTLASSGLDMAASAITSSGRVGAARNLTMIFSNPYFWVDYGALVQNVSAFTCPTLGCTPTALANRTIGAIVGSEAEVWVQDNLVSTNLTPSSKVTTYSSMTTALSALQTGSIEILFIESYTARGLATGSGGNLRVAGVVGTNETYSFAFPRTAAGSVLAGRINTALQALMANGVYDALLAKWFSS